RRLGIRRERLRERDGALAAHRRHDRRDLLRVHPREHDPQRLVVELVEDLRGLFGPHALVDTGHAAAEATGTGRLQAVLPLQVAERLRHRLFERLERRRALGHLALALVELDGAAPYVLEET